MTLRILARHAHSMLNVEHRINGDPLVSVPLTDEGREQARRLGEQLANVQLDLVLHTRFGRTRETAELALSVRDPVPLELEPLLDDIDVGELEGSPVEEYRAWKRAHRRGDVFPGGESLDAAAQRYADAFRRLATRPERRILVVCHEIPVRYALNGARGSDSLDAPVHDVPNATPYLFDSAALAAAAERVAALSRGEPAGR
jgi:broad specificity phosphatase PhoE